MSYNALVCKLSNIRRHSNADRLQVCSVNGYSVVIGLDQTDGDLGVFFGEGGKLSEEMCYNNNLFTHKEKNKDITLGGFFGDSGRVRAQRFRGEISEGFWTPLSFLDWAGDTSKLKDGDQFDTFCGHKICEKYYTPATLRQLNSNKQQKKQIDKYNYSMLVKHYDTKQVRDYVNKIPVGSIISISEKIHGTSGRTGFIKTEKRLRGFKALWNKFFPVKFNTSEWVVVSGTRNTVMRPNEHYDGGFYVDTNFRGVAHEDIKSRGLKRGETLYYELVGYTDNLNPIMSSHSIEDKSLAKKYGSKMVYKYGCQEGEFKIRVYRITQTNEDGYQVELSWPQIVSRCKELGLTTVPHLVGPLVYDGDKEKLLDILKKNADGPSTEDASHIREGVVVRVEHSEMWEALKYKGFWFCTLEGLRKNSDDFIDEEEIA
jgi:hypothetical protein